MRGALFEWTNPSGGRPRRGHDITDPYFSSIAAGAMREAERHGLVVTIASTLRDPEREIDYVRTLQEQRARAIIVAGSRLNDRALLDGLAQQLRSVEATGGRAALVSQHRLPFDTVVVENRAGAQALAEALHGLGHRRFAVLTGPSLLQTAEDRLAGFREGLARRGVRLDGDSIVHGDFTREGGYRSMTEALERGSDATCVFAVNDVIAVGATAALRAAGLALSGDMAIAGFDDIVTARDVTPTLTTVRLPLEQLGEEALRLILDPAPDTPRVRSVPGEVVIRESTPPRR
jgi:LacI family transcriptional regulator